ncbi:MAG: GAF domain-containing protein [Rhodospirillales bacterium]|nr:GAF domain-containing protein [Rhodospirillales bacterium]
MRGLSEADSATTTGVLSSVASPAIARKALEDNEAVLTRDARLDFAGSESIISANIRSAVCVPLITDDKAQGLIYLDSSGRDRFTAQQRDLLVAVGNQAAINIERARLTEELRQQARAEGKSLEELAQEMLTYRKRTNHMRIAACQRGKRKG